MQILLRNTGRWFLREPCKVVTPDTFKDDIHVVLLFNVVNPDTFNDDNNVVSLFNVVKPDTFIDDNNVVSFDNNV